MKELLVKAEKKLPQMIEDLKTLVEIESPSDAPAAVNNLAKYVSQRLEKLGATPKQIPG